MRNAVNMAQESTLRKITINPIKTHDNVTFLDPGLLGHTVISVLPHVLSE